MPIDPSKETYLGLDVDGVGPVIWPADSATYVQCELGYISEAVQLRRDVNGGLWDLSDPAFRKLRVLLSASDLRLPAIGSLRPGMLASFQSPIAIREVGNVPSRVAVQGSVEQGDGWVEYRPQLVCRIADVSMSETEWQSSAAWSIELWEV